MVNDPENPRPDLKPYAGQELTVIAWLWARTVKSPNPALSDVDVPLVSNFILSTKTGKETYVEPEVKDGGYSFTVKVGRPGDMGKQRTRPIIDRKPDGTEVHTLWGELAGQLDGSSMLASRIAPTWAGEAHGCIGE